LRANREEGGGGGGDRKIDRERERPTWIVVHVLPVGPRGAIALLRRGDVRPYCVSQLVKRGSYGDRLSGEETLIMGVS
jgi:hypothetical protein